MSQLFEPNIKKFCFENQICEINVEIVEDLIQFTNKTTDIQNECRKTFIIWRKKENKYFNDFFCLYNLNNKYIVVASNDKTIKIIEANTKQLEKILIGHKGQIKGLYSENNFLYSLSDSSKIFKWNLESLLDNSKDQCYYLK